MSLMPRAKAWRHVFISSPVFILLIGSVGLLWQRPWPLFALLSAACLVFLWRWWSARSLGFFLMPLILGPCAEYFAVLRGAWTYTGHEVLPIWLPPAWGLAGLFLGRISDALESLFSAGSWFSKD